MGASAFLQRQIAHIRQGGRAVFYRKARKALGLPFVILMYVFAVPAVIVMRLIRPWLLVRLGALDSPTFGNFAGEPELYLCEKDAGINRPARRHVDLFYLLEPVSNRQLAAMWKRSLRIWPRSILLPIKRIDQRMPGEPAPACGATTQMERDVHNLLDRFPPHLGFTDEEEARGRAGLRRIGVPQGARFVCLNVRDSAYYGHPSPDQPANYETDQAFRNNDVQNYVLAAEALADRGYVVVRVGAIVHEAIRTGHPGVIDYATNGMRSEFMDLYLGAKCAFCVSEGSGFDAVPWVFRRPVAYVNVAPLGALDTHSARILAIPKHYHQVSDGRELSLAEIFSRGAGFLYKASEYEANGIRLAENTPGEIRDLAVEMAERLEGVWQPDAQDEALQRRFWILFPKDAPGVDGGKPWHGEIRSRIGAAFLRANRNWLN